MYNYGRLAMFPCLLNLNLCVITMRLLMLAKEGKGMGSIEEVKVYLVVLTVTFLITCIALVVMIVNDIRFHGKDQKEFEYLEKSTDRLNSRHDRATVERDRLSNQLSTKHDHLSKEHDRLSKEHYQIKEKLNNIYMNQEMEKETRETAGRLMPEESKMVNMVNQIYNRHTALMNENMELQKENKRLRVEIEQLRSRKIDYTQDPDWEDIDIPEDSREDDEWER